MIFLPLIGALFVLMQQRGALDLEFGVHFFAAAARAQLLPAFGNSIRTWRTTSSSSSTRGFRNSGFRYHLGIDGISLLLVLLTTILISLSLLYSGGGDIDQRPREFCFFMLVLETGLLGALLAVDLFLFYVFWEVMLIPMYFLIGIWGHGRRDLRGDQVRALHDDRLAADAGRDLYLVYHVRTRTSAAPASTCRCCTTCR